MGRNLKPRHRDRVGIRSSSDDGSKNQSEERSVSLGHIDLVDCAQYAR